ncbi:Putative hydrolase MhqD [Xylophilus ampelinus]|nr:phospholipase [Variovorax sp.]VTY38023.1 Putative hydrolase MhqD [Xylophilus ampelinus]
MADLQLPLTFLHRPAAEGTATPWLLLLMHGVNSHEEDLFGLARFVAPQFHVLSLRAPNVLVPGAYAWFQFQVGPDGQRRIDREQERESRFLVGELLASAAQQLGVPADRVVAAGFSQGGIMALSLLLTRPALLRAALVWHSRLLPEVLPDVAPAEAFAGKTLWISHGSVDNVIPPEAAQATRDFAATLPLAVSGRDYPVAHTIAAQELRDSMDWLQSLG